MTAGTKAPNPSGLCMCGCGERTNLARHNSSTHGWVKGEPIRYINGHQRRRGPVDYIVDPETGCWEWQRALIRGGYGRTTVGGRARSAHIVYWERVNGPVPDGHELDHLCRNRCCVNPNHLEPVTRAENVRRGHVPKLNPFTVAEIRARSKRGDTSQYALAAEYDVSQSAISDAVRGRTWRTETQHTTQGAS